MQKFPQTTAKMVDLTNVRKVQHAKAARQNVFGQSPRTAPWGVVRLSPTHPALNKTLWTVNCEDLKRYDDQQYRLVGGSLQISSGAFFFNFIARYGHFKKPRGYHMCFTSKLFTNFWLLSIRHFFQRNMSSCRPDRCHKMHTYSPHRCRLMNARCIKLGITLNYIGTIILHKIVREKNGSVPVGFRTKPVADGARSVRPARYCAARARGSGCDGDEGAAFGHSPGTAGPLREHTHKRIREWIPFAAKKNAKNYRIKTRHT